MTRSYLMPVFAALTIAFGCHAPALAAGTLDGRWLTQDQRAVVVIAPCGDTECGKIVWVKDPIDPSNGKPRRDKNNPDMGLTHRPIIGLETLYKIVANTEGFWDAVSYDPRSGEEHEITIKLTAGGAKMVLRGCALGGLICRSEVWMQAPAVDPAVPAAAN